ncbi:hypothetical protein [Botrimarina mediterranea]|uniref:hypothetical protein n=1 Tax=Botrimarina mediterranea TaxID=2528022 RepID=UPI00118BF0B1|nr:hypothetical protein K2D_25190 [Planctomycetes bacterium K2D]
MDRFLQIPSEQLTRKDVVQFLPLHFDSGFVSQELKSDAAKFNEELNQANASHTACCRSIDDALSNLAKAPDAAELRKAVGERADNTLNDVQRLARLWSRKVELVARYREEVERDAPIARSKATAKRDEVLNSLRDLGFDINRAGFNNEQFVAMNHPEARELMRAANALEEICRTLPQRIKAESEGAAHAERYVRAVAERYVAGKL